MVHVFRTVLIEPHIKSINWYIWGKPLLLFYFFVKHRYPWRQQNQIKANLKVLRFANFELAPAKTLLVDASNRPSKFQVRESGWGYKYAHYSLSNTVVEDYFRHVRGYIVHGISDCSNRTTYPDHKLIHLGGEEPLLLFYFFVKHRWPWWQQNQKIKANLKVLRFANFELAPAKTLLVDASNRPSRPGRVDWVIKFYESAPEHKS